MEQYSYLPHAIPVSVGLGDSQFSMGELPVLNVQYIC